tara:strand:- start:172 stop:348 length:177 start_codon:yes stop_codon:yes gene_type:complete
MNNLTDEQTSAITHAWLDCMAMANIGETDVDLGSLAEAGRDSAQELEDAFPFLNEKRV